VRQLCCRLRFYPKVISFAKAAAELPHSTASPQKQKAVANITRNRFFTF
jgi:hypothetical protein